MTILDPYPGCDKVSGITDLWSHSLLHSKLQDALTNINFVMPPSRMVFSGHHSPIHQHKGLVFVSLGMPTRVPTTHLSMWHPAFFAIDFGPVIVVDVPVSQRWMVHDLLPTLNLPGLLAFDHARTRLAKTQQQPRSSMQIHLHEQRVHPLLMDMMLLWLRRILKSFGAIMDTLHPSPAPLPCCQTARHQLLWTAMPTNNGLCARCLCEICGQ